MERERHHFDYGILPAIGLIGLAIMTGMVRLGWSGTLLLDLIQWVLIGIALVCGVTYLVGKTLGGYLQNRPRSTNKRQGAAAMDHNPPRPGQPISRDRALPFPSTHSRAGARGQAYEGHAKRSSPQTSFHRSPEPPQGRRGQQSLPAVIQPPVDVAPKPRRHRRRRGGRGKAPSSPAE